MTARRSALQLFTALIAGGSLAAVGGLPAAAAVTQDPPEKVLLMMLEAAKKGSYDDFLAEANDQLRGALTRQQFEGVSGEVAPRLQKGYKAKYLAKLRKDDHMVHLWKLEFSDGKDDVLVTLSVKDKKVAGIFLQ